MNCQFSEMCNQRRMRPYLAGIVRVVEPLGHGEFGSGREAAVDDGAFDAELLQASRHRVNILGNNTQQHQHRMALRCKKFKAKSLRGYKSHNVKKYESHLFVETDDAIARLDVAQTLQSLVHDNLRKKKKGSLGRIFYKSFRKVVEQETV